MELLLFDRADDVKPSHVIALDPVGSRTYHYWHVFLPGVQAGQLYGFRAHGPFDPSQGMRLTPTKSCSIRMRARSLSPSNTAVLQPVNRATIPQSP